MVKLDDALLSLLAEPAEVAIRVFQGCSGTCGD
jgi:hypothetical protein